MTSVWPDLDNLLDSLRTEQAQVHKARQEARPLTWAETHTRLTVYLPLALDEKIRDLAVAENTTPSKVVVEVLERGMNSSIAN